MVTVETVLDVIPVVSLIVVLAYYTLTIRNQNRTRQAQLLMGLYETYRSPEFRRQQTETINQEWTDFDDFWKKYGGEANPDAWVNWQSYAAFFHGVGVLLKKRLIDIALVEELLVNAVFISWVRMGPIVKGFRTRLGRFEGGRSSKYATHHGFEYLYNELKKREQHSELKT